MCVVIDAVDRYLLNSSIFSRVNNVGFISLGDGWL